MRTILYAGLTANGNYGDSDTGQMPKEEELNDLFSHAREAGNVVMGRKTYEIHGGGDDLDVVVISRSKTFKDVKTVASIEELFNHLKSKGHKQAFVIGGVTLQNSLLTDGLVDEIYINIEPYMDKGLNLGPSDGKFIGMKLINHKHIGADIVQIHYEVSK